MSRTFLQLVQAAADEIGIPQPSAIIGQVDDQSRQLLALANREGKEFSARAKGQGGWQKLHKEHTFTTVNGTNNYALPTDFEYFAQRSFWDDAYRWELLGPIPAQQKQLLRYGLDVSGPRRRFYVRNDRLYLDPTPDTDGQTIAFDYYSNAWCSSSGGTAQTQWTADTDLYLLDEDCFVLGMKWRYLRAKGLDYAQEASDYEMETQRVLSRDGGSIDLSLSTVSLSPALMDGTIPDTGFGE